MDYKVREPKVVVAETDDSLCPVTKKLYEVDNRENPVLITKTYHHNFLCF